MTTLLYWSMIEAGLAIIACCLPTLQSLLPKDGVQSMIAGLRSMASFRPLRSVFTSRHASSNRRRWPFLKIDSVEGGADAGLVLKHLHSTGSLSKPTSAHGSNMFRQATSAHEDPNVSRQDSMVCLNNGMISIGSQGEESQLARRAIMRTQFTKTSSSMPYQSPNITTMLLVWVRVDISIAYF